MIIFRIFICSQISLIPWYWMQFLIINDDQDFESHHLYIVNEYIRGMAWYFLIVYVCYISTWDTYCYSVIGATSLSFRHDEQEQEQERKGQQGFLIQADRPQQVDIFPKRVIGKTIWVICLVIQTIFITGISFSFYQNGTFSAWNVRLLCGCQMFECQHSVYSLYKFVVVCCNIMFPVVSVMTICDV